MDLQKVLHRAKWIGIAGAATGVAAGAATAAGVGIAGYMLWRGRRRESLHGQVALVTGASRGLGLAIARELAMQGCRLAICARHPQELQVAADDLRRHGADVLPVPCDIGDREQVNRMVEQVTARYGRVDILINNAGVITVGPMESQTIEDYEEAMRVMFWGVVYPTLAVVPQMIARRGGRIANITSIGGKISVPHLLPYGCAKFAAVGFSEGLHAELRRYGVRVTTVVPGLMRTGSHINAYFKGNNEAEYTWFSLGATLPLVSIDGARAARKIVAAVQRRQSELIITPQARAAVAVHGLAPGLTADALAMVNRLMPNPNGEDGKTRHLGRESETAVTRSPITALGRRAARDFHQQDGGAAAAEQRKVAPVHSLP